MTNKQLSEEDQQARAEYITRCEKDTWRRFPRRFATAAATDPDVTAWCDTYIQTCHQNTPPPQVWSLLLLGPTGTGKTWQAYGAIRRIVTAGIRITWLAVSLPDLLDQLRPRDGTDSYAEYERWAGIGLLLVDDLGADKPTEWAETTLYRLVNHRSEQLLPTIWTSNLPFEPPNPQTTLKSELSSRVFSRLTESQIVTIKGEDRRKPPKTTP